MKRKVDFRMVAIIVLLVLFLVIVYWYFRPEQTTTEITKTTSSDSSTQTISEAPVETKTILNTISSSRRNCFKCRRNN